MKKMGLIIGMFLLISAALRAQTPEGFVLIGNKTGLKSVSKKQLAGIFQGSQSLWKTGEQVIVVMPSAKSDFSSQFSEKILKMSYPALQKFWLSLVFQGRASAPVFLNSSTEMLEFIRRNPGAIAVVKMSEREAGSDWIIQVTD